MRFPASALRSAALLLIAGTLPAPASAQHLLVTEYKNKPHVVRRVVRHRPHVMIDDKPVAVPGERFVLHQVDEYLPVFIGVRNVRVKTSTVQLSDTGGTINNDFQFAANFVSAHRLDHVFVVLELTFESGERSMFVREVGRLEPDRMRWLDLVVPIGRPLGKGHYRLHLFVDGLEALHSEQPLDYREAMLDRMIAKRVQGRPDGPPAPFVGPPPAYPERLENSNTKGQARVRLRIRSTGAVLDPVVLEATDPAFGEAAIEALRQWRFYPRIQNGAAVDATVDMPIEFIPPQPEAKS